MRRHVTVAAAAALAASLLVLGATEAGASAPSTTAPTQKSGHAAGPRANFTMQIAVKITNDSSHDLIWSGDRNSHQPTYTGPTVLKPGWTTFFVFEQPSSTGSMTVFPSWRVGDTSTFIYPGFSVPLIGGNGYVCTGNEVDAMAPAKLTGCSIGSGYSPTATVVVQDRKAPAAHSR